MDIKEIKISVPDGYEIDKENSTFDCIKFKSINKGITYEDVCRNIFEHNTACHLSKYGDIQDEYVGSNLFDKDNSTNRKQLEKLLALNQLLNIATYYNSKVTEPDGLYTISYNKFYGSYCVSTNTSYVTGITASFN